MSLGSKPAADIAPPGTWSVDSTHSTLTFTVRHMMLTTLKGRFTDFEGTLEVTEAGAANASGAVRAASIDTDESVRDARLRSSEEFFDTERYPEIRFRSRAIERVGGSFRVLGDLTMRDVTNPIELEARVQSYGRAADAVPRISLLLRGKLSRRAFGMTWNETLDKGGALVGDTVSFTLEMSASKTRTA